MDQSNELGRRYSTDEHLTLSQLRKQDFSSESDTSFWRRYCECHQIGCMLVGDKQFQHYATQYARLPYLLYYQGNLQLLTQPIIGVVGPRLPSSYAIQVTEVFFSKAQSYHLVSVSGFAKGIDQKAHQLSLQYHIPTIAVLGGGFQYYLNGRDRSFLEEIVQQGGLVLSQFKLGFSPTVWSFPQRNKLIAELARILFLPEAKENSGSLITAEFAYQAHKPVFSVPAPLFSAQSAGIFTKMNEKKIQLITHFDDCLSQYFSLRKQDSVDFSPVSYPELSSLQQQLLKHFGTESVISIDTLLATCSLSYADLLQELTILELKHYIQSLGPGIYGLSK